MARVHHPHIFLHANTKKETKPTLRVQLDYVCIHLQKDHSKSDPDIAGNYI